MLHYGGCLRQGTEVYLGIPAMAYDGYTPSPTSLDTTTSVWLTKNDNNVIHPHAGGSTTGFGNLQMVRLHLDTTDTDTCGRLLIRLVMSDVGCIQDTWAFYIVISAAIYDALVGSSLLPVNMTEILAAAANTVLESYAQEGITGTNAALDAAIPQLTASPPATPSLRQAAMLPFMAIRNERTQSSTEMTVKNDAGTIIGTKTITSTPSLLTAGKMEDPVTTTPGPS